MRNGILHQQHTDILAALIVASIQGFKLFVLPAREAGELVVPRPVVFRRAVGTEKFAGVRRIAARSVAPTILSALKAVRQ